MASEQALLDEGSELVERLRRGEVDPARLTPREQTLYHLGRGRTKLTDLSDEGLDLLGYDRPLGAKVARVGTKVAGYLPRHLTEVRPPEVGTEDLNYLSAARRALEEPGPVEKAARLFSPPPRPGDPITLSSVIGSLERPVMAAFSPLGVLARTVEGAIEQVPRLTGSEPTSSPLSRLGGNAVDMLANLALFLRPSRGPRPTRAPTTAEAITGRPVPISEGVTTRTMLSRGGETLTPESTTPATVIRPQATPETLSPRAPIAMVPELSDADLVARFEEVDRQLMRLTTARRLFETPALARRLDALEAEADALNAEFIRRSVQSPPSVRALTEGSLMRGGEQIALRREPSVPDEPTLGPPIPQPPVPETRGVWIPRSMVRPRSDVALPPGSEPRALPEAPRTITHRPYSEGPVDVGGGPPPPPAVVARGTPVRQGEVMLLDREGRPITDQYGRPVALPPAVKEPPGAELPTAQQVAERRAGRPSVQQPPPEPPPPAVPPPPAPPLPPPSGGLVRTYAGVDLTDPFAVQRLVRGAGGINRASLGGEAEGLPRHLLRVKGGVHWDELVDQIAKDQSRPPKDVERELSRTLNHLEARKGEVRARAAGEPSAGGEVPDWARDWIEPEQWSWLDDEGVAQLKAWVSEQERLGGTPPHPKGSGPRAFSFVPPIPMPGVDEEERGTTTGRIKDLAQILGVTLPVAAMAFARFRRGPRRPRSGGPGQEGFRFEGAPETPAPPVRLPTAPAAGAGAGVTWLQERPPSGAINAFGSADGRFRVVQETPDRWVATEPATGQTASVGTFHDARQWVNARSAADLKAPRPEASGMRTERTPLGDQGLIPGAEQRQIPSTRLQAPVRQRDVEETPLFGQERQARARASDEAQGALFAEPPPPGAAREPSAAPEGPSPGPPAGRVFPPEVMAPSAAARALWEAKPGTSVTLGDGSVWRRTREPGVTYEGPDGRVVRLAELLEIARKATPPSAPGLIGLTKPRAGLFGVMPPIPVPGPDDEDEGTAKGAVTRAAQILGLAAPVLGILVGRGAGGIRAASPRLAKYLDKSKTIVDVERRHLDDPYVLGETTSNALDDIVRAIFGKAPVVTIDLAPGAGARTAAHEGIHAAYLSKGPGGYPPRKYLEQLYQHYVARYPQLAARGKEEAVIDSMAQEVLRRGAIPLPEEVRNASPERLRALGTAAVTGLAAGLAPDQAHAEHEQSRTIERDGRFFNVHGTTGEPLPPRYPFEREAYDTLDEAVRAAERRSKLEGQRPAPPALPPLEREFGPSSEGPSEVQVAGPLGGFRLPRLPRGAPLHRVPAEVPPAVPRRPAPVEPVPPPEAPPSLPGRPPLPRRGPVPEPGAQPGRGTAADVEGPGAAFDRAVPPDPERIVEEVTRVRDSARPGGGGRQGGGGRGGGPERGPIIPTDPPGEPLPEVGRTVRFFRKTKLVTNRVLPPEEVVRGDPGAEAVVHLTIRSGSDGELIERQLLSKLEEVRRGFTDAEVVQVGRVLDGGPDTLSPRLRGLRDRIRSEIIDADADATHFPREFRMTAYFPHFRDTVTIEGTKLVLDPTGTPYLAKTTQEMAGRFEPFFHRRRTADDPPTHEGLEALRIYQKATARHLTMNGGTHPVTGEVIPGYLNELQALLDRPIAEAFKPYLSDFVNHHLGAPGSKGGLLTSLPRSTAEGLEQVSRIGRQIQVARLMGFSPSSIIGNATQQGNTLARVSPSSWLRGYKDLLDPTRRALAKRWLAGEDLHKLDLDRVRQTATALDTVEGITAKLAHVSMRGFALEEVKGNRYHAFLAGLRDAEDLGLTGRTAIEFARDLVDATQFPSAPAARIPAFRGPFGALAGQFKAYQIRQTTFVKNLVMDDWADWTAALDGRTSVPVKVRGQVVPGVQRSLGGFGTRYLPFHRTAKFLMGLALIGGPDAIFPGLDDWLREQGVKFPGLLPGIGLGVAQLMGFGMVQPGEVTRSLLFTLPGPLIGHIQDALSGATGLEWGHGLNDPIALTPLSPDQRADRAIRGFLPVAGVMAARGRRALKEAQTPGEERAARTALEALGLEPASGPRIRKTDEFAPARTLIGLPPAEREREHRRRESRAEATAVRNRAVSRAADDFVAGDREAGKATIAEAERQLGLRPGRLRVGPEALRAARERQKFTSEERQVRRTPRDIRSRDPIPPPELSRR